MFSRVAVLCEMMRGTPSYDECTGRTFLVQRRPSRTLAKKLQLCRLPLVAVCLLLVLTAGFEKTAEAQNVNLYGVIVGVNKYVDAKHNLRLAAKDAQDIRTFLNERKDLFSRLSIKLLLDEEATKDNIIRALRDHLTSARREDIVLIYLAGHGSSDSARPDQYYFWPHEVDDNNLSSTAVLMSDRELFQGIKSERVLLVADACHSGGYLSGLARGKTMARGLSLAAFSKLFGRFGIAAAAPNEVATEVPMFGNGVFTFFFLKGIRGSADANNDGVVTVKELYDYVASETKQVSNGKQNPQLYSTEGEADSTPVYMVPVFSDSLNIELRFFYEEEQERVKPLTEGAVLKSGQHVGIAFKPDADCYVHILWWDSSGQVGRLFPNPQLTEGTGFVRKGEVSWLPSRKEGKHWYVLDDKPGDETIYLVASRQRNPKLEKLYEELQSLSAAAKAGGRQDKVVEEIEREINLMGFADHTVPMKARDLSFGSKEQLFQQLESKIKVAGAEAFFKLTFKHVAR